MDEPELVERARRGDVGAYESGVAAHKRLAFTVGALFRRMSSQQATADGNA